MKKILFITNNWYYDYGGRKTATTKIINDLSHRGFDITFANFEVGVKPIAKHKVKINYNFHTKVHVSTYFIKSNKRLFLSLIKMSKKYQFNVIICSGDPHFDIMTIFAIKIFNLFKKTKIILFAHIHPLKSIHIFSFPIKDFIFNLGYYISSYFSYRLFDKIVTPGISLKKFFVHHLLIKQEKITVINHPILNHNNNEDIFTKKNLFLSFVNNEKVLITAVRLNIFQKDFQTLFRALKELNKKIRCRLIILGEGEDREKIIKLAKKLKIYNHIHLLGFKKNPIEYMKQADVFVFSSRFEGCPIILVEAMIAKIPIVSTDCDFGPKDILENGKNGILVPVGDYKSMAKAILKLLEDNKLKERFVKNGLNKIKDYYETRSFYLWNQFISKIS